MPQKTFSPHARLSQCTVQSYTTCRAATVCAPLAATCNRELLGHRVQELCHSVLSGRASAPEGATSGFAKCPSLHFENWMMMMTSICSCRNNNYLCAVVCAVCSLTHEQCIRRWGAQFQRRCAYACNPTQRIQ